jgi:hypothetical protein
MRSYFNNVERFTSEDFIPSEEDCIMARTRTTGIVETRFSEGPAHFQSEFFFFSVLTYSCSGF